MRSTVLVILLLGCTRVAAAPPEDQWFTVLLDGRKIGSFESRREARGANVVTTQTLDLVLDRAGTRVALASAETSTETRSGKPIAFRSVSQLSGSDTVIDGTIHGGRVSLTTRTGGGAARQRTMPWPEHALLAEGLRLVALKAGLATGTRYSALAFQPSSLDAATITSVVGEAESVDLPLARLELHPVEQTMAFPGAPMTTRAWVDADQTIHKLILPVMGVDLTLLACDRACATAPNQTSDVFDRTLVTAPRALDAAELAAPMRYALKARAAPGALTLPETDEQHVERVGDRWLVTITPDARAPTGPRQPPAESEPDPVDFGPTDWLQSTAPEVAALARHAAGPNREPRDKMLRIEIFVRGFIRNKSLGVGYASALEVVHKPEGDCTEHAVLVAALGRANGIATRVVDGLAYAPGFAGRERVFVPHAWAQAWIDGRWQSFDAALMGFDAGHIALSVGDGDPWRFYSGLDLLGRIDMESADAVAPTPR